MKKHSFGKKFKYWFDKQMSKGTAVMIGMLSVFMLIVVLLLALAIMLINGDFDGTTIWTVFSTTINAWMPDAEEDVWYTAFVSIAAIFGLFFTSFIIGIISSGVEDKLSSLRQGNSTVIESNHIVILGFKQAEYTLIEQLILAAAGKKICLVVADDMEKTEMEETISSNVAIPKNVKLICRHADITDPNELECCSIETAAQVIVQPFDDKKTIKALLAIANYMEVFPEVKLKVTTAIDDDRYVMPNYTRHKYGFNILRTRETIARIIAHSCTQSGLSKAFMEVFDFNGNEFYLESYEGIGGKKFKDIFYFATDGVPVGVYRDSKTYLNPDRDMELTADDKLIVFEREAGCMKQVSKNYLYESKEEADYVPEPLGKVNVLIIGANKKLGIIVDELPDNVEKIQLAGIRHLEEKHEMCKEIRSDIVYELIEKDVMDIDVLEEISADADQIVVLNDYSLDEEESDLRNMMIILKLRDIKERLHRNYTITAEMRREDSRNLINDDTTDFIVSSNMSAMILTQIAQNDRLYNTFNELLSNKGNEFELKDAGFVNNCVGITQNVAELRRELLHKKCILLGVISEEETILNPPIDMEIVLSAKDKLIVISEH